MSGRHTGMCKGGPLDGEIKAVIGTSFPAYQLELMPTPIELERLIANPTDTIKVDVGCYRWDGNSWRWEP